jgi:hypothetical protein
MHLCRWLCQSGKSWKTLDSSCTVVGLSAPSQRYSTIKEEEACQLWPEKKWLLENEKEDVVVVPKRKVWA